MFRFNLNGKKKKAKKQEQEEDRKYDALLKKQKKEYTVLFTKMKKMENPKGKFFKATHLPSEDDYEDYDTCINQQMCLVVRQDRERQEKSDAEFAKRMDNATEANNEVYYYYSLHFL